MVAGILVQTNVEVVSREAGLNAVNPVTDSLDWQSVPIVSLVLFLRWMSLVFNDWRPGESESLGSGMRLAPLRKPDRGCRCEDVTVHADSCRLCMRISNIVQNWRPSHQWKQASKFRWDALNRRQARKVQTEATK